MSQFQSRSGLSLALASILFFLSGATGLAYQVAWSKRFSHVWGSSTLAMAAVVASFLFGLGLGAHLLGRHADRSRSCLSLYGIAEIIIGLWALLIPFLLQGLRYVSAGLYPFLEASPLWHSLVRFALTFVVIGPACVLMGGTLPLLIKHFTPSDGTASARAGWLYAINTLGAATGAYLAGFHILPGWGLHNTNLAVAGLNLVIGVLAIAVARIPEKALATTLAPGTRPETHSFIADSDRISSGQLHLLYITVALTGAASLILEMVWTRQLAVLLGGSTYAFSAMLFVLLIGIGLGSLIYDLVFKGSRWIAYVPAVTITLIAVSTYLGKALLPEMTLLVGTVKDLRAEQGWNAAIAVSASCLLQLLPAIGMGILFPVFIERTRRKAAEAGKVIGAIYAWNTVGSIIGATITFLWLVPSFGLANTTGLAIALYGVALFLTCPPVQGKPGGVVLLVILTFITTFSFALVRRPHDPFDTDMGFYLYGPIPAMRETYTNEFFKEGSSSNIFVTRTIQGKNVSLHVNGKVDASSQHDMNMQLGLAYFPILLAPEARELCVIGFGSGTTSGAALLFPQTHVTCCEIEPAVVAASVTFHAVNHQPELSNRLDIIYDDGRSHLQGTRKIYDLILSEPSNPWIAGVSNLFTQEFYQEARARLGPNGILAQWLQVYNFSLTDYAMVARTVLSVFPECGLVRISTGDTILLASQTPLANSRAAIDKAQALVQSVPKVQADLKQYFKSTDVRSILLDHIILDTQGVRRLIAQQGAEVLNTDLNLKLEFDAPLRLFGDKDSSKTMLAILASADVEWFERAVETWGCGPEQAGVFRGLTRVFDRMVHQGTVRGLVQLGLKLDPARIDLLVEKLAVEPELEPAVFAEAAVKILISSKKEANRLGVLMFKSLQFERATEMFRRLLEAHPGSASVWNNLAIAYELWGKLEEADQAFQRSLEVDPLNEKTRGSYETFQRKHPRNTTGGFGPAPTDPPPAAPTDEDTEPPADGEPSEP